MALITNYTTLQSHIADELIRTDLTNQIPTFIQSAEAVFNRDPRVRKLADTGGITISADGHSLPSDYRAMESWYHDGPTYYGEIENVGLNMIGNLKASFGTTGVPQFFAVVGGTAKFAPVPNDSFDTQLTYWRKVEPLASNSSNWLLDDHSDIYLYGALVESAPFLKDDNRVPLWEGMLEKRIEQLHLATEDEQFSGSMRRNVTPIG